MLKLKRITPDNWRCGLRVSEKQQGYVAPPATLLARAYAYRGARSRARLIMLDGEPVGMTLWYDLPEMNAYDFSQLFIDERYQGRGLGREAARLVLEEMRRDGRYPLVYLCYIDGNEAARRLYEQIGFTRTWDDDEDEIGMVLKL